MPFPTKNHPEETSDPLWPDGDESIWNADVVEGGSRGVRVFLTEYALDPTGKKYDRFIRWVIHTRPRDLPSLLVKLVLDAGADAIKPRIDQRKPSPMVKQASTRKKKGGKGGGSDPIKSIGGVGPSAVQPTSCRNGNSPACSSDLGAIYQRNPI